MLKYLIGRKKNQPPTTQEVIQKLRVEEDKLTKRGEVLQMKIDAETDTARKNASKNERALMALKRKKGLEKQLQETDHTLLTIEYHRQLLETANTIKEVLKILSDATKELESVLKRVDIEEQPKLSDQSSGATSEPAGFRMDYNEDELLNELEKLKQEGLDKDLLQIGGTGSLPNVPSTELPAAPAKSKAKHEDDDLRELDTWAN